MDIAKEAPADVRPQAGETWFERSGTVGTGEARNSYLFERRVHVQLKIAQTQEGRCTHCGDVPPATSDGRRCARCGSLLAMTLMDVIDNVRCYVENDETDAAGGKTLAINAANLLVGRTIAEAARMTDDAYAVPGMRWIAASCTGQPFLIADAVRDAIHDWSKKATDRAERLPPEALPPPPSRVPLWRRALRLLSLFRGLGV